MRHVACGVTSALLLAATIPVSAQNATAEFDVVSVKRNTTASGRAVPRLSPDRVSIEALTLRDLIGAAFRSADVEVVIDGPGWIDTDLFEVEARTREGVPAEMTMLQPVLVDRFKLRVRRERRERPIFRLSLVDSGGALGPQLTRSTCTPAPSTAGGTQGTQPTCAPVRIGGGPSITGEGVTMSQLAGLLAGFPVVNRVVHDGTTLDGRFDFRIQWVAGGPTVNSGAGPDLFAALRDQLGLQLERGTGLVDVIVVDQAERLTEN